MLVYRRISAGPDATSDDRWRESDAPQTALDWVQRAMCVTSVWSLGSLDIDHKDHLRAG